MTEKVTGSDNPQVLPFVDDVKPDEEDGPIARSRFTYRDEIAVSFLVDMLETSCSCGCIARLTTTRCL
ncbi:hypothetical protein ACFL2Q_03755 [Thermodesulfobacteriota bacterium]